MSGGPYVTTAEEIEVLCGYIKNDQAIADYFGISVERVKRVRDAMPNLRPGPTCYTPPRREGSGLNAHDEAAQDARQGSCELNRRLQLLFSKWEEEHGFREGAGQILLPAGYDPARERVAA